MDHYTDCDHCGKAIHDGPYYSNINFIGDHVICDCCKNQIEGEHKRSLDNEQVHNA